MQRLLLFSVTVLFVGTQLALAVAPTWAKRAVVTEEYDTGGPPFAARRSGPEDPRQIPASIGLAFDPHRH